MKKRKTNLSIINARATASVSVGLVLLILGIVAATAVAASNITRQIKENLGFDIVIVDDTDPRQINALKRQLESENFTKTVILHTPEEALAQWEEATGENVVEIVGVNPFSAELDVRLNAGAATADSIETLASIYRGLDIVDEVTVHSDMIEAINNNTRTAIVVMTIIALALLLISFVLINNTVRLTVYARRFIIHTMKLVGATDSFIRRPFVVSNAIIGFVSGIVASLLLFGLISYASTVDASVAEIIGSSSKTIIYVSLPILGSAICTIASVLATNRYLRISYDDMFD